MNAPLILTFQSVFCLCNFPFWEGAWFGPCDTPSKFGVKVLGPWGDTRYADPYIYIYIDVHYKKWSWFALSDKCNLSMCSTIASCFAGSPSNPVHVTLKVCFGALEHKVTDACEPMESLLCVRQKRSSMLCEPTVVVALLDGVKRGREWQLHMGLFGGTSNSHQHVICEVVPADRPNWNALPADILK